MIYFLQTTWKANLFLIITTTIGASALGSESNENVGFSDYIKEVVAPYIKSMEIINNAHETIAVKSGGTKYTEMSKFIEEKVKSLIPYLNDENQNEAEYEQDDKPGQLTLDGDEKTTIIEFVDPENKPRATEDESFKNNIEKYKKLRKKINKALDKELVTNKTKTLVTSTVDSMLAEMIGHQCSWKSTERVGRGQPVDILRDWSQIWGALRGQYGELAKEGNNDPHSKDQFLFKIYDLFNSLYEDVKYLSQNYKVLCEFVEPGQTSGSAPFVGFGRKEINDRLQSRRSLIYPQTNLNNNYCSNIKFCYTELKDFFIHFYNVLNNTGASVISNYAEMYARDVSNDNFHEKDNVIATVHQTAKVCENKIQKLFKKEVTKFELDPLKDTLNNTRALYNFIANMINYTQMHEKKLLSKYLHEEGFRDKLVLNIEKDISVNLHTELGNLERDLSDKICQTFETCNGMHVGQGHRRSAGKFLRDNGVFVKVQLSFDDEIKNKILNNKETENSDAERREFSIVTKSSYPEITRTIPHVVQLLLKDPMQLNEIRSDSDNEKIKNYKSNEVTSTPLEVYKK